MREKHFPVWEELEKFHLGFETWGAVQGDGKDWKEGKHAGQREELEQRSRGVKALVWTWGYHGRSSSRGFTVLVTQSRPALCSHIGCILCSRNSPGKNTWVGSHSLLQGIFPTQGLVPYFESTVLIQEQLNSFPPEVLHSIYLVFLLWSYMPPNPSSEIQISSLLG